MKGLFTANRTPPYFTRPLHSTPPLISKKKGLFSTFMLRGLTIAYKARQERQGGLVLNMLARHRRTYVSPIRRENGVARDGGGVKQLVSLHCWVGARWG